MRARFKHRTQSQKLKEQGWLEQMQLNSWEAELLVSALTVFALYRIPDYIFAYSKQNFSDGSGESIFFETVAGSIYILAIGFIIHLILRSFWVAQLGISYAFPKGINSNSLRFKARFKRDLENQSTQLAYILKIEKIASAIYGISFILFGALLGTISLFGVFGIVITTMLNKEILNSYPAYAVIVGLFVIFYVLLVILLFSDFLFDGYLRKRNWTAKLFYPFAVFFRVVTLSFLYRRSLLILQSNLQPAYRKSIPFILFAILGLIEVVSHQLGELKSRNYYERVGEEKLFANYEDLRQKDNYLVATIPSEIIQASYLSLFIKDLDIIEELFELEVDHEKTWRRTTKENKEAYLKKIVTIRLDEVEIDWQRYYVKIHPVEFEIGYELSIDLSRYPSGFHELSIEISDETFSEEQKQFLEEEYSFLAHIPFYYQKP